MSFDRAQEERPGQLIYNSTHAQLSLKLAMKPTSPTRPRTSARKRHAYRDCQDSKAEMLTDGAPAQLAMSPPETPAAEATDKQLEPSAIA